MLICRDVRYFSDVKMAVWISIATGLITGPDLLEKILPENSGLVRTIISTGWAKKPGLFLRVDYFPTVGAWW